MSVLKPGFLIRNIYRDDRLTLQLFVPPPETIVTGMKYQINSNVVLYLQMSQTGKMDTTDQWKSRRFPIKQTNLYEVVCFFDEILFWYQDKSKEDLFLETDDGQLIFNSKYNELYARTKKRYFDNGQLKAVPALIEVAQGKFEEGAYLYINRRENMVPLTKDNIQLIFSVLRGFNFSLETLLTIDLLRHSVNIGTFVSQEEFNKRRENNGFIPK